VKHDLNRRIAMLVYDRLPQCDPVPMHSDITFVVTYPGTKVEVAPSPVYVYGRYLKYSRDLPQARWLCGRCMGRGCESCGGTGRCYPSSVEEVIAGPLLACLRADATRMHATGRQDVDVRMLGNGRPFVLELLNAHRRSTDFQAIEEQVNAGNAVEVRGLRIVDKAVTRQVDTAHAEKSYHAVVRCERALADADLAALAALAPVNMQQQTPRRVSRRRADMIRDRCILRICAYFQSGTPDQHYFELDIHAQSGSYIKEFVSGDSGRTRPSISEILASPCVCEALDVTGVSFDPFDPAP